MGLKKTPEHSIAHEGQAQATSEHAPSKTVGFEGLPAAVAASPPADNAAVMKAEAVKVAEEKAKDPVREYRAVAWRLRDPITGLVYYTDRPVPGKHSNWLTAQVKAGTIVEV